MKVRRVVTGHDASGRSIFAGDQQVEPITLALLPGAEFHRLWGADEPPTFPGDGSPPVQREYFPPVGGFRFGLFTVPPGSVTPPARLGVSAALAELEEKLPGMARHMEPDHPGMHTTDTIDFEIVVSGEIWLELDGGAEVHLEPGDTVIQNGTRHAWHNKGAAPAVLAVAIVGAHRR